MRSNEATQRLKVISIEMFVITQTDTDADYYFGLSAAALMALGWVWSTDCTGL